MLDRPKPEEWVAKEDTNLRCQVLSPSTQGDREVREARIALERGGY
ncbi:hypothetical protein AB0M48_22085 [Lentzea sp. NPDC051208]